ncbi:MAG: hypothetical protein HY885_17840 [Deltaproteobacteria bacterium]|nr:hypothetical protein [Deltaproteobacteria bacterium]
MDKIDRIAHILEWFALPLTYLILLFLFLFFVVRPFFSHLFNFDRIKAARKAEEEAAKARENTEELPDNAESPADTGGFDKFTRSPRMTDDRQNISKLAESDPERAGNLVKQWIKKDGS